MLKVFDGYPSLACHFFLCDLWLDSCKECFWSSITNFCNYNNLNELAGETYQQTDANFLDAEKDTFRDDGSTASTAVLVDNHLYVANVGDSRTIISKAGKGKVITYYFMTSSIYSFY